MQEEVENRTLTLVVSGTKFTGRLLKAAISKYMAHCKEKKLQKQRSRDAPVTPHGKQTVKHVVWDARVKLLTSQGPGTAIDFGLKIIDLLVGREKAHEVASQLVMAAGIYNYYE